MNKTYRKGSVCIVMYNYSKLTRKVCEILDEHDLIKEVFKENDKYYKFIYSDPDPWNWECIRLDSSKINGADNKLLLLRCDPEDNLILPLMSVHAFNKQPDEKSSLQKCIDRINNESNYRLVYKNTGPLSNSSLCVITLFKPYFEEDNNLNYQILLSYLNDLKETSNEALKMIEQPLKEAIDEANRKEWEEEMYYKYR